MEPQYNYCVSGSLSVCILLLMLILYRSSQHRLLIYGYPLFQVWLDRNLIRDVSDFSFHQLMTSLGLRILLGKELAHCLQADNHFEPFMHLLSAPSLSGLAKNQKVPLSIEHHIALILRDCQLDSPFSSVKLLINQIVHICTATLKQKFPIRTADSMPPITLNTSQLAFFLSANCWIANQIIEIIPSCNHDFLATLRSYF